MRVVPLKDSNRELRDILSGSQTVAITLTINVRSDPVTVEGTFVPEHRFLSLNPPVPPPSSANNGFSQALRAVYVASGLIDPIPDPLAWCQVQLSQRPLLLIPDTSALANGTVHWLAHSLWNRSIELAVLSVVERELFGWSDQEGFWNDIPKRTKFRVARRMSETPLRNVIDRRPHLDEKAALMLAKLKIKDAKSPDADVLLIEQARDLIRAQSQNIQTLFVTGDRNHARSAVSVLTPRSVLYCPPPEFDETQTVVGSASFWQPCEGFGAIHLLSFAQIIWTLLAAFDEITFTFCSRTIRIKHHLSCLHGVPSDWIDPHLELHEVTTAGSAHAFSPAPTPGSPGVSFPTALRPSIGYIHNAVNLVLTGQAVVKPAKDEHVSLESFKLLQAIGLIDPSGSAIAGSGVLESIRRNDWLAVSDHFQKSPAFMLALDKLSTGERLTSRDNANLALARRLSVAVKSSKGTPPIRCDSKLTNEDFLEALAIIVGDDHGSIPFEYVSIEMAKRFGLHPMRFESQFRDVNDKGLSPYQWETGGSAIPMAIDHVFFYDGNRVIEKPVSCATFTFGSDRSFKSMRRKPR